MDVPSQPFSTEQMILLIEPHPKLRAILGAWLQTEFPERLIETSASLESAERVIHSSTPRAILVSIEPWHGDGLASLTALRERLPGTLLVALTIHGPGYLHQQAIQAGASACACIALSDGRLRSLLRGLWPTLGGLRP